MSDLSKYIKNGRVERETIAMDIKNGEIDEADLNTIINNPSIKATFIGREFKNKKSSSSWSKDYLDELSYAVVSESFNVDYLKYLYDVAKYVNASEKKKRKIPYIVVAAVIIIAIIIGFIVAANSRNKYEQQSSIATTTNGYES